MGPQLTILAVTTVVWLLLGTVCDVNAEEQKSTSGETIGCFVCGSNNGSDARCMDPFYPTDTMYQSKCETGISGRVGTFPAHYCIKMKGTHVINGAQVTARVCSMTTMHNQCGNFKLDDELYWGCITSCNKNGCNHGQSLVLHSSLLLRTSLVVMCLIVSLVSLV